MATPDSRQQQYAKYLDYPLFSYKCITHMLTESEDIWRLLYYNTPDALDQPNLTIAQKRAMIYRGEEDATRFNVFMDIGQSDVFTKEMAVVRISPWAIKPENYYYGKILMSFEAYSHYKINTLNNYQTRVDTIIGEFLRIFNGALIGGVGRLYFNMAEDLNNKISNTGQIPWKGKQLFMSNVAL